MNGMSMPDPEVAQAFDEALRAAACGDDDRRWELVSRLRRQGGRTALDFASRLSRRVERSHRTLAADVLSQLGSGPGRRALDGPFRDDALALLLAMARHEQDPQVLSSILIGFGHIGDQRCVGAVRPLHTHADPRVRAAVTFALLGRPEREALQLLITLSADGEPHVRDWAAFGLARQTDQDFPQLRDALADRLTDDDPDTRAEAIHGLAVRGDQRALRPLLDVLASPPPISDPGVLMQALYSLAIATADARLHPYLVAEHHSWLRDVPDEELPGDLQAALARYDTHRPAAPSPDTAR